MQALTKSHEAGQVPPPTLLPSGLPQVSKFPGLAPRESLPSLGFWVSRTPQARSNSSLGLAPGPGQQLLLGLAPKAFSWKQLFITHCCAQPGGGRGRAGRP